MNATTEIAEYVPLRKDLAELKTLNAKLVFDYNDKLGNQNARSHIYKMRQKKADVERVRRAAKQSALEFGRKVDAVAAELTGELDAMIEIHQKPIDEIEAKAAAAKQAEADRIERERLEQERIERERQQAAIEAERAEAKRVADELAALKRQQETERIQREAAERAKAQAEAKAKAEQDAIVRREREAHEARIRVEQEKIESERRAIREAEGFIQSVDKDGVTLLLTHESGEWIRTDAMPIRCEENGAQAYGSAISYAKRYQICAVFGITADEDDDGNGADGNQQRQQTRTQPQQRTNPSAAGRCWQQPAGSPSTSTPPRAK
jgi:hypothetical protein